MQSLPVWSLLGLKLKQTQAKQKVEVFALSY